jgi:hypothetical protein
LPIWAGVVPMQIERKAPVADSLLDKNVQLPDYLT